MPVSGEDLRRFLEGHRVADRLLREEELRRVRSLTVEAAREEYDMLWRLWAASPKDGDQAALDRRGIEERVALRRKLAGRG
ncbi:MAG TPA: hypothetical protein VFN71_10230 [Methylomirabilota bacterium]|nr:hypothetical protein [Methylomirabilota bacterium]